MLNPLRMIRDSMYKLLIDKVAFARYAAMFQSVGFSEAKVLAILHKNLGDTVRGELQALLHEVPHKDTENLLTQWMTLMVGKLKKTKPELHKYVNDPVSTPKIS